MRFEYAERFEGHMIIVRLVRWALRFKDLPTPDYRDKRVPTFREVITGISHT